MTLRISIVCLLLGINTALAQSELIKDFNPGAADGVYANYQMFDANGTRYFSTRPMGAQNDISLFKVIEEPLGVQEITKEFSLNIMGTADDKVFFTDESHLMVTDKDGAIVTLKTFINTQPQDYPAVLSIGNNILKLGGKYVFPIYTKESGIELWITDATAAGTSMIRNIGDHEANGINYLPVQINDKTALFVAVNAGEDSGELWKTDGTANGTTVVKSIRPGYLGADIQSLTAIDGVAYFTANNNLEIWRSDGTESGTTMITNMNGVQRFPNGYVKYKGYIYFITARQEEGFGLWRTDETADGTELVINISSNLGNYPQLPVVADRRLFFVRQTNEHGVELWVNDGTSSQVIDIIPGAEGSNPKTLTPVPGGIYFTAAGKLWRSGGEPLVTEVVDDESGSINHLSFFDGALYYNYDSELYGQEFFRLKHQPFVGVKKEQEITFDLTDKKFEDETFELEATASSSLPVSFESNSGKITIIGTTATIKEPGKVQVTANQEGDAEYYDATERKTICINPPKPNVVFVLEITGGFNGSIPDSEGIQWYIDGVPVDGSNGPVPIAKASGTYSVDITIDGCRSPMSDPMPYTYSGLEDEIAGVKVYPNSVKDFLHVSSPKTADVEILNATGQSIHVSQFSGDLELPFSSYANGMYFVRINADQKVITRKIVKE